MPALAQRLGERLHLRRLADPLPAFEADEPAARAHAIPNSDLRPSQMRPKKPASPTSSPATSGTICGGVSPVVIDQLRDLLPLGDRRDQRALVADLHAGSRRSTRPAGTRDREVARRDQRHFARAAQLHLGGADLGARLEQRLGLPGVEAPLDQPRRFLHALVPARHAGEHLDQAAAVLLGRAGEAVARLVGVAGLEPVGARHMAEDRVAVVLRDVLARRPASCPR